MLMSMWLPFVVCLGVVAPAGGGEEQTGVSLASSGMDAAAIGRADLIATVKVERLTMADGWCPKPVAADGITLTREGISGGVRRTVKCTVLETLKQGPRQGALLRGPHDRGR